MDDAGLSRKYLSFEQAEGVEPLPEQLKLRELSPQLRARLWQVFFLSINENVNPGHSAFLEPATIFGDWQQIFYDKHVLRDDKMVDEFNNLYDVIIAQMKVLFSKGNYVQVLGLTQWVLRHPSCPYGLAAAVDRALEDSHAAYRVVDGDTIAPIASEEELNGLKRAFADVAASEFGGARRHLRSAASELTAANWPASVRESIHAVESVARALDSKSSTLAPALATLEKSIRVHPALKAGFSNLYGYTSDEKGVRHALLEKGAPQVDQTDALYMLGACAAFVSYLISKARTAGLLKG
jgi:hypothetical protein